MGAPSHVCWICVPEMCNNFYEPGAVTTKAKGGRAGSGSALRSGRPSACVIDKRRGERGRGMHGMQPKVQGKLWPAHQELQRYHCAY